MGRIGSARRWAGAVGPAAASLWAEAKNAVLVNISGHLSPSPLFDAFRRRVMVDIDPGFTQFWHADGLPGARVAGHDMHFTIGERIGHPDCPIPTNGIEWRFVRPPVVLDDWPVAPSAPAGSIRFTTVGSWRGAFGPVEHGGRTYGVKAHEFRRFVTLPTLAPERFEIALDIHPADASDRDALERNGWAIVDPRKVASTPDRFRDYVRASAAEFSVAQGVYVDTASGWFSDRTTRYLASGRPALVQDTGFSESLPVGERLVAFTPLADAVRGAQDIAARYPEHAAAARRVAERHFDARRVLEAFWDEVAGG